MAQGVKNPADRSTQEPGAGNDRRWGGPWRGPV